LATASVVVLIGMQVAGLFAAGKGSFTRCMGWPLWQVVGGDRYAWLQGARLATAVVAAEMLLGLVIRGGGFGLGVAATYSVIAVALLWALGLLAAVARVERVRADDARPEAVSV
jgi:cytochrome c oxidase assembly protein subunit 15